MNKHVNKKRLEVVEQSMGEDLKTHEEVRKAGPLVKQPDPNLVLQENDRMPYEVATGLLCQTNQRASMRSACWDARSKHWVSTRKGKTLDERTMQRLARAEWRQVVKWHKRAVDREYQVQHVLRALNRAAEKLGQPNIKNDPKGFLRRKVIDRSIKAYEFKGTALQAGIECLEAEISRRMNFVQRVSEVAPTVASGMLDEMSKIVPDNSPES